MFLFYGYCSTQSYFLLKTNQMNLSAHHLDAEGLGPGSPDAAGFDAGARTSHLGFLLDVDVPGETMGIMLFMVVFVIAALPMMTLFIGFFTSMVAGHVYRHGSM